MNGWAEGLFIILGLLLLILVAWWVSVLIKGKKTKGGTNEGFAFIETSLHEK